MRRHPDFGRPLPRTLSWRDSGWMLGALLFGLLVICAVYVIGAPYAHGASAITSTIPDLISLRGPAHIIRGIRTIIIDPV
jgi:hypothetical protein